MVWHARCLKLGLKHGWLYTSRISYYTTTNKIGISEGILTHMYPFCFISIYSLKRLLRAQFIRRVLQYANSNRKFLHERVLCPRWWGERIYCHPQTDCFVESHLISVARRVRCLELGSKPGWLYDSQIYIERGSQGTLSVHRVHSL